MSEYKQISLPSGVVLLPCPFCGSPAEMNEFTEFGKVSKVVSCTNSGDIGEGDECVMYFPSSVAYKATKREAIAVWNARAPVAVELFPPPSIGDVKPAQAAAIPEQWTQMVAELANDLESEILAKYTVGMLEYPSQKRSFDADMDVIIRAKAMLSASPKPL